MLFLGRIHPVRGLLELVEAWRIARPEGWKMIIAGPDEGGHQQIVEAAIHQAGLQDDFEFTGSVYGDEKKALYRSADIFVLPTFSENFGLVVAEALACGVPVITTKGAPWQGLQTHRCGWWIDIGVEPLVAALREAMNLPPDTLREMGQRGRAYVEQNFGWPGIAQQMLSVYRWVLGVGAERAAGSCDHRLIFPPSTKKRPEMSILNTLSFLLTHPLSQGRKLATLRRFVAWQIGARLVPGPVACPFANGSWLLVRPSMTGRFDNNSFKNDTKPCMKSTIT